MKVNYFVLYPNDTYEFVEKEITPTEYKTEFLDEIEKAIGDYSYIKPLSDFDGYFLAYNDCVIDNPKRNRLAECLTHAEEDDVCVLTKCYVGQACFNDEFETFSDDDRKYFELIFNEQLKVINDEKE